MIRAPFKPPFPIEFGTLIKTLDRQLHHDLVRNFYSFLYYAQYINYINIQGMVSYKFMYKIKYIFRFTAFEIKVFGLR